MAGAERDKQRAAEGAANTSAAWLAPLHEGPTVSIRFRDGLEHPKVSGPRHAAAAVGVVGHAKPPPREPEPFGRPLRQLPGVRRRGRREEQEWQVVIRLH